MERKSILIVEDEFIVSEALRENLESIGFRVAGRTDNVETALDIIHRDKPDLILIDICLRGEKSGLDLARAIQCSCQIPFLFITAISEPDSIRQAKEAGLAGAIVGRALYESTIDPAALFALDSSPQSPITNP